MPKRVGLHCERTSLQNGLAFYDCASTYDDDSIGEAYFSYIDLHTGAVHCDCPGFKFKPREGVIPDIGTPKLHCIHLERVIADCIEKGEIEIEL